MTGALCIEPVDHRRLAEFIRVPFGLQRGDPMWVPPLLFERRMALKAAGTPYLRRAQTAFWIARRDGRAVGRISAQIDPAATERQPGTGHFGLLAAENDAGTVAALLGTAEGWLRDRGMTSILGPFSLSINEESGLLVDGFGTPPMVMMPHDPPYLGGLVERAGYAKAKDLLAYLFDCARDVPPVLRSIMERALPEGVTVRPLRWKAYQDDVRLLADIFKDAWSANWGFIPFSDEEVDDLATHLRPIIDARLVWFAEVRGEAVAFIVCLPNLNEAVADLNGRLLPLGWIKLLWRLRVTGTRTARVPLMGVRKRMSATLVGAVLPFLLIGALRREVLKRGVRKVEISWVLDDNRQMKSVAEALCGAAYKTYRVFGKPLS